MTDDTSDDELLIILLYIYTSEAEVRCGIKNCPLSFFDLAALASASPYYDL